VLLVTISIKACVQLVMFLVPPVKIYQFVILVLLVSSMELTSVTLFVRLAH